MHEARELRPGAARTQHLVAGLHRLIGAAMTSFGMIRDSGRGRGVQVEEELSAPAGGGVGARIEALRAGSSVSPGLQAMARRLRGSSMVTARRCELLPDKDWYGSKSFNEYHRPCGFDDYIYSLRSAGPGRIIGLAVRRGLGDRRYGDEERNLLELFHQELARLEAAPRGRPQLTPREQEVLQWFLRGASEKEVANQLALSRHTVHTHTRALYMAYGVSSRAELLARCLAR
jgi:DNA-binding CsgD family transcriptional regulator